MLILIARRRGDAVAAPLRVSGPRMRRFLGRALPHGREPAPQLLIVAGAVIASASPSAVSWLIRQPLIELPLAWSASPWARADSELTRSLRDATRTSSRMPNRARWSLRSAGAAATLGLIALSEPIVRLLFEQAHSRPPTRRRPRSASLSRTRPAGAGAGEDAVAGLFRTRGYACPLYGQP